MSEEKKADKELKLVPFITGESVDLAVQVSEMASMVCKWVNDPKVRRYSRTVMPLSLDEVKKWFEPSSDRGLKDFVVFLIYHKKDKKPIGDIGLNHINWLNKNANIFFKIGEKEYWGKGIAAEASKLVITYGFTELNLHKIYSGIYSPNSQSFEVSEKLGFKKEAVLKEEIFVDGKYEDIHKFALFKQDWLEENK